MSIYPERNGNARCVNQFTAFSQETCPSTITCSNPKQVVCVDGKCVDNESFCESNIECPIFNDEHCWLNQKCRDKGLCKQLDACGHGKLLCENLTCNENCN